MGAKRRFLAILLALSMLLGLTGISAAAAEFSDMPDQGDWSYAALDAAVKNGLMMGTDGKLLPGATVSRAQFGAILGRAFGAQAQDDLTGYNDVAKDAWYYADMAKAVGMKALAGSGDTLRPEEPITRQEAFVALARVLKLTHGDAAALADYSDAGQVSPWAAESVAALVGGKYIQGADGKLNPLGTITRAELAQVMHKLIPSYITTAGTYSEAGSGNVMVNFPGVTLKGLTVAGDLILGEGVGEGDVTLSGVTVQGRLVVRGGGGSSIHIADKSTVGDVVMGKTAAGAVRVVSESGSTVAAATVDDGVGKVVLEGAFGSVAVGSATPVTLQNATVATLDVQAEKAAVSLEGKTSVTDAKLDAKAQGATLSVAKDSKVAKVESAAPGAAITGAGKVTEAVISGDNTKIDTVGTKVTVSKTATGVTAGGKVVVGGETIVVKPSTPGGGSSSGPRTVTSDIEFLAALGSSSVTEIVVGGRVELFEDPTNPDLENYIIEKPVTINAGASLRVRKWTEFHKATLTVKAGGILIVDDYLGLGGLNAADMVATLDNRGTITVNNTLDVTAPSVIKNTGTITLVNEDDIRGTLNLVDCDFGASPLLYGDAPGGTVTGTVLRQMMVDQESKARAALAKTYSAEVTDRPYYDQVFLMPGATDDQVTFTLTEDFSFGAWASEELPLEVQQFIIFQGVTYVVPSGITFTIEAQGNFRIQGTVDVEEGTVVNNGSYFKAAVGTLLGTIDGEGVENSIVTTSEGLKAALAGGNCEFIIIKGAVTIDSEDAAAIPNLKKGMEISEGGSLTIPGGVTLTLGNDLKVSEGRVTIQDNGALELNEWCLIAQPSTLAVESGGSLTVSGEEGFLDLYGTVVNAGTFTVSNYVRGNMATINNSGTITTEGPEGNLDLTLSSLANTGTVTNDGQIHLSNCTVTGTAIAGENGLNVSDLFSEQESFPITCASVPDGTEYNNYEVRITDQAGLKKAMNMDLPLPEDVYVHIAGDVTVTEAVTLNRNLSVNGDWNGENGQPITNTLTIVKSGSVAIPKDVRLEVGNYGVLDVRGSVSILGELSANWWDDDNLDGKGGEILNSGSITVEEMHEEEGSPENNYYPRLVLNGEEGGLGTLVNEGALVNKRDLNINGGLLDFKSGSIVNELDAYMGIRMGGKLTAAEGKKITNRGGIDAFDSYDSHGGLLFAAVVVPPDFYVNEGDETSHYTFGAEVWSTDDIAAALEAGYAFLRVQGELTWDAAEVLRGIHIQIDNYWNEEGGHQSVLTLTGAAEIQGELCVGGGAKLAIASDATVAVGNDDEDGSAFMINDGEVENGGTITVHPGSWLGGGGSFTGTPVDNQTEDDGAVSDGWKVPQE